MKIKILSTLCLTLALCAAATAAFAQTSRPSRLYLAGYMGLNIPRESGFANTATNASGQFKFSNAGAFAGALGVRLSPNVRIEAEFTHRENDLSSTTLNGGLAQNQNGTLTASTYMANVYYDFNYEWRSLKPYLTFGLGAVNNDITLGANGVTMPAASDDTWDVAWQVGGGLKYKMNDLSAMTFGYRYMDMGEVTAGGYTFDNNAHEIRVGFEYSLPVLWGK